eukprot:1665769-Alexandrium_andersonii.AAC.1
MRFLSGVIYRAPGFPGSLQKAPPARAGDVSWGAGRVRGGSSSPGEEALLETTLDYAQHGLDRRCPIVVKLRSWQ